MGAGRFAVSHGFAQRPAQILRFDGSLILRERLNLTTIRNRRFLPDPSEGLPAIVRGITANANCERYLVVTKYNGVVPGTKMEIKGIGAYSQGIGSFVRH